MANSRISDEVWQAVKQINPLKALATNGMHMIFYHKCWNVISKTVHSIIRAFLHHGHFLKELNNNHVTLNPKKENPTRVNNFRPQCNVSYKFIQSFFLID